MSSLNVESFIAKFSKPYWPPFDPSRYVVLKSSEDIAAFNLFWVMHGKFRSLPQGFITNNLVSWLKAVKIVQYEVEGCPLYETLIAVSVDDFYKQVVLKYPAPFIEVYPLATWAKLFNAT
jgi:hypothetical protein